MGLVAFVAVAALAAVWAALVAPLLARLELDPYERVGLAGVIGLGAAGLLTFLVKWLVPVVPLDFIWVALTGLVLQLGMAKAAGRPLAPWVGLRGCGLPADKLGRWVLGGALCLLMFPLIGVFAPSTTMEWDSLAYHLAVPKLWAAAGKVGFVPGMHQSNFPFGVEVLTMLFPVGTMEVAAKAVAWMYALFGACALYGVARRRYGSGAEWSPVAFLAAPVVLWESGTAYIDVAHGLFAGLAILYASEWKGKGWAHTALVGALLGFAAGTKYTGLQTVGLVGLGLLVVAISHERRRLPQVLACGGVALLLCGGWYVKTYQYTGNPVFPFFYEKLGGRDWDQWRADVYANEQKSFGVGRTPTGRDLSKLGHGVLGLAYQPGRYTNPDWDHGNGLPTGAIGGLALAVLVALAFVGTRSGEERFAMGTIGLQLVAWFVLSQQSRYMTTVVVVGAGLMPALFRDRVLATVVKGAVVLQALYSAWLMNAVQTTDQLRVAFGLVAAEDYRDVTVGFSRAAKAINQNTEVKKVALYNEVFGYLLDKPYFWANPGHSTSIPYLSLASGAEYGAKMRGLGFSHAYFNLSNEDPARAKRWLEASGLTAGEPYTLEEKAAMERDPNLKMLWLTADAVKSGSLTPVGEPSKRLLMKFR